FLAEKGKKVTITRRGLEIAVDVSPRARPMFLNRLTKRGVAMLTGVKYEEITDKGLVLTNSKGQRQTIEAHNIVLAVRGRPNRELFEALKGNVPEIHLVGDCVDPRNIMEAVDDGSRVARAI
ncbi:FAD-dependent oxidoreductase, partial [Chloroflexota bacterium]